MPGSTVLFLSDRDAWAIRPFAEADRAALLRLNVDNRPAVAALDDAGLSELLAFGGHHLVAVDRIGAVMGYLLSFPRESDYTDTEICEFRRRLAGPFLYICQIVVAQEHRRRRIGRTFYESLLDHALKVGAKTLCCDVNTDPPNPKSFAFHHEMGFVEIGRGRASDGTGIAYLVRKL